MESIINSIPGYRVNEYMLALRPHEELRDRVRQQRQEFAEKYRTGQSAGGVYLALTVFSQYAMLEERISSNLDKLAMGFPPFRVELKDFGSFPSHTVYINVCSRAPVQQLVKTVRSETQRLMKLNDEHKPHFILEPHLSIARKLKPWQYEKGWLEYSHRHFRGSFIAHHMVLLKRPSGEMKYQLAGVYDFRNLPVQTKQGELFG